MIPSKLVPSGMSVMGSTMVPSSLWMAHSYLSMGHGSPLKSQCADKPSLLSWKSLFPKVTCHNAGTVTTFIYHCFQCYHNKEKIIPH